MPKKKNKQEQEEDIFVFVYGTLKRGGSNHRYLDVKGSEFIEETTIRQGTFKLLNINNQYPALVFDENGPEIHGELYKVTRLVLNTINILEGYNDTRENNLFDLHSYFISEGKKAFIYIAGNRLFNVIYQSPKGFFPEIPSGNWEIQKQ